MSETQQQIDAKLAELTDSKLVLRLLSGFRPAKRDNGRPLWGVVMECFSVGCTMAHGICRRHGFDPDMRVKQRRL